MTINELITALQRLEAESGSIVCLGCGYEHNCDILGCAIIREATEKLGDFNAVFNEETIVRLAGRCLKVEPGRLRELAEVDKAGRLAVLPCKPDGSMLNTSDPERPEIMKRIHFAVAYVCGGIVFHQPYNIFLENVAAGYIRPLNEEAEKALEAMQNE